MMDSERSPSILRCPGRVSNMPGISSLYAGGVPSPLGNRGKARRKSPRINPRIQAKPGGYCLPDPRQRVELALCAIPRGASITVGCDDPTIALWFKAVNALNARGKAPALRWTMLRHGVQEGDARNAFWAVTRLI